MGVNQDPTYQAFFGAETEVGTVKVIKTWIHPQKVVVIIFINIFCIIKLLSQIM